MGVIAAPPGLGETQGPLGRQACWLLGWDSVIDFGFQFLYKEVVQASEFLASMSLVAYIGFDGELIQTFLELHTGHWRMSRMALLTGLRIEPAHGIVEIHRRVIGCGEGGSLCAAGIASEARIW